MTEDALIIACNLDHDLVRERIHEWVRLVRAADALERVEEGVRLRFARGGVIRAADVGALAEAERDCCPFFRFTLAIDDGGLTLLVDAPREARALVDVLLGLDDAKG